jgi:hypothetical protein
MPRIQPIAAPVSPRLASGTKPAAGFGDTPGLSSTTPKVRQPSATSAAATIADLAARRAAQAALWSGYSQYTGYRVSGDGEVKLLTPVQFTVTSDPPVVRALDAQVPDSDRVRYDDGAYGYIMDRFSNDRWMAPSIDQDVLTTMSPSDVIAERRRRFEILRAITELTQQIHAAKDGAASTPVIAVTPPAPTLRIVGMPSYGTVEIDGVRTKDDSSRWADAMLSAWIVPAASGAHTVRVIPPTGGGAARTARVTIPETGEASVTFSTMTPEADTSPVVTPHETVPAVTTGTVIFTSRAPFSTVTSAVLRSAPAVTAIPLSLSGDSWTASVPAGRYTLEVIVQPYISSPHPASVPEPPARQSAADVNVVAGQTVSLTDADLHETGQTVPHGDATPPAPTQDATTGSVIVRSTVPNTAAMIQRVTGSQGELGPGITMTRGRNAPRSPRRGAQTAMPRPRGRTPART